MLALLALVGVAVGVWRVLAASRFGAEAVASVAGLAIAAAFWRFAREVR